MLNSTPFVMSSSGEDTSGTSAGDVSKSAPEADQDPSPDTIGSSKRAKKSSSSNASKKSREAPPLTKVVVRRLPPGMTESEFLEQVSPLPEHNYFYFVEADKSLEPHAFSRAYINFVHQEDIFGFRERFDGYVFVDGHVGQEFPALVEFAPYQKVPKKQHQPKKKKDPKVGTIESDPDYMKFLEEREKGKPGTVSIDQQLEEIEAKEKERVSGDRKLTPLLEYIKEKRAEKQRIREEKREAKRRKAKEEEKKKRNKESEEEHASKDQGESSKGEKGKEDQKDGGSDNAGKSAPIMTRVFHNKEGKRDNDKKNKKVNKEDRQTNNHEKISKEDVESEHSEKAKERQRKREERQQQRDRQRERRERLKSKKENEQHSHKEKDGNSAAHAASEKTPKLEEEVPHNDAAAPAGSQGSLKQLETGARPKRYSDRRREDRLKREMAKNDGSSASSVKCPVDGSDSVDAVAIEVASIKISEEDSEEKAKWHLDEKEDEATVAQRKQEVKAKREKERRERKERIKNKERPAMQIYRPGMGKFSSQTIKKSETEEGSKDKEISQKDENGAKKIGQGGSSRGGRRGKVGSRGGRGGSTTAKEGNSDTHVFPAE